MAWKKGLVPSHPISDKMKWNTHAILFYTIQLMEAGITSFLSPNLAYSDLKY